MSQYVIVTNGVVTSARLTADGDYAVHYPGGIPSDWILTSDDDVNAGWTYDGTTFSIYTVSLTGLRNRRDELIALTDWRMVSDYQGSDQAAWQTYRQELRDMTVGYTPIDESSIVWPTEPV